MKKFALILSLLFLINLTACSPRQETVAKSTEESAAQPPLLTSAPVLTLTDPLSSTLNKFELPSGNYSWSYMEGDHLQSLVACGIHPLDSNMEKAEKLKVPAYNQMDRVSYMVSCPVSPSRLTVREWDVSHLGDTEAEAEESVTYEEGAMIELDKGKVYEITAVWEEEDLAVNGFYGEASYAVITE